MKKLFVLGDSISIHYGPFLEQMLKGSFKYSRKSGEENLENPAVHQGANGGDSSMCLHFLKDLQAGAGLDADILLLNCGLHDVKASFDGEKQKDKRNLQVSIDDYKSNLKNIVDIAAALKTKLIWMRTTPVDETQHNTQESGIWRYSEDVDKYNSAADEIMKAQNIPSIDLYGFTTNLGDTSKLLYDGRHFNEDIRKLQASYIAGWLESGSSQQ